MLTVEQAQGQHYVLVLWGPGAAWYTQLQRKKGKYTEESTYKSGFQLRVERDAQAAVQASLLASHPLKASLHHLYFQYRPI